MYYHFENVTTFLDINPSQMDKLNKQDFIYQEVVKKVEGRCYHQYGYIVLVLETKMFWGEPLIEEDGYIRVQVFFQAIGFKLQKNQIIDCFVEKCEINHIIAKVGHTEVIIPKGKIPPVWEYKIDSCIYENSENRKRIKKDTKLRVQVVKIEILSGIQMKIIANLTGDHLGYIQDDD